MADAKKKASKKKEVKSSNKFKITKPNGGVIYRENLGDYVEVYNTDRMEEIIKAKSWIRANGGTQ